MDNLTSGVTKQITESLTKMLGPVDIVDPVDVWKKLLTYRGLDFPMPRTFRIQGRVISGIDRDMVEFVSIVTPRFETISLSFQSVYPKQTTKVDDSYSFDLKYPEKFLIIKADTMTPIAKIINLVDGSMAVSPY